MQNRNGTAKCQKPPRKIKTMGSQKLRKKQNIKKKQKKTKRKKQSKNYKLIEDSRIWPKKRLIIILGAKA